MTATPSTRADAEAVQAVLASLVEALPLTGAVDLGAPTSPEAALAAVPAGSSAVHARFRGARSGSLAVVLSPEAVQSVSATPEGEPVLSDLLQPCFEAGAAAVGPAAVDPLVGTPPALVAAELGSGGTAFPLLEEGTGALVALVVVALDPPSLPRQGGAAGGGAAVGATGASSIAGLHVLHGVEMAVTVELGRTRMTVRELLALTPGSVVELDRAAGTPADLLVNGRLIARGEVVVVDEDYGIRITEIVPGAVPA